MVCQSTRARSRLSATVAATAGRLQAATSTTSQGLTAASIVTRPAAATVVRTVPKTAWTSTGGAPVPACSASRSRSRKAGRSSSSRPAIRATASINVALARSATRRDSSPSA
ncbi:hypothetical protein [Jiangella mangrovi]|uniref:Uncharacterized protein n=1 Tax=Jiangella mangrovi TaxID=1524084 RepID=A0A7W9LNQ9_9ACTN|nr:hypothetical protein [Jiangella mangrovi]MBB5790570.1 hypothetical protein [Jiangella mangrovi]